MQPFFILTNDCSLTKKKYVFFSYSALLLVYILLIIIFLVKTYQDLGRNTLPYYLLLDNWRQPIITDIMVVRNSSMCPQDYSYLIPFRWGGSSEGCDCRDVDDIVKYNKSWSDLNRGSCSIEQYWYGCHQIPRLSPREMPKWAYGVLLCAKKEGNETFINNANYRKEWKMQEWLYSMRIWGFPFE